MLSDAEVEEFIADGFVPFVQRFRLTWPPAVATSSGRSWRHRGSTGTTAPPRVPSRPHPLPWSMPMALRPCSLASFNSNAVEVTHVAGLGLGVSRALHGLGRGEVDVAGCCQDRARPES